VLERDLRAARDQLATGLWDGIVPLWLDRAPDLERGGFFTELDGDGRLADSVHDKHLVTQTRLIWAFSAFAREAEDPAPLLDAARRGVDFLEQHFLDREYGGWRWRVSRDGIPVDEAKLVFGQTFALYALAAFARSSGEQRAHDLAVTTFDLLQRNAVDAVHGGYLESFDRAWSPDQERKTLDIHLHVLEAFTELLLLTGDAVHARRLREARELITTRMIDVATGAGGMQYSRDLTPVAPVPLGRTWIAERPGRQERPRPTAAFTCYGHNLELGFLLGEADAALAEVGASDAVIAGLADHALRHGYDREHGGVYREGPADGEATDTDKEFWQNAEALPGFLEGYRVTKDEAHLDAFLGTWSFAQRHLVHPELGEWRVRTDREGSVLVDQLGNPWKNCYHTGRAALESVRRLDEVLAR